MVDMIFPVAALIAHISSFLRLLPGDVLITGTPSGVGMGHKPEAIYLKPGDVLTLGIDGLGQQTQTVIAAS